MKATVCNSKASLYVVLFLSQAKSQMHQAEICNAFICTQFKI